MTKRGGRPEGPLHRFARMLQPAIEVLDSVRFAEQVLGLRLYPRQKTILRLVFLEVEHMTDYDRRVVDEWRRTFATEGDRIGVPGDIWDRLEYLRANGFTHFLEVLFIFGRRGSKNFLAAIIVSYLIYRLVAMGCPQAEMGLDPETELIVAVVATTHDQAKNLAFRSLVSMISRASCFEGRVASVGADEIRIRTPHDEARMKQRKARGGSPGPDLASIRVLALSSSAPASRGYACVAAIFDEMAHLRSAGTNSADELYHALRPALDQAKKHAMILITTTPRSRVGQAYEEYEHALAIDPVTGEALNPTMFVAQLASWDPYLDYQDLEITGGVVLPEPPQMYNELLRAEERRNPEKFRVERRAQWQDVVDQYLRPELVEAMFLPYCARCGGAFQDDEWERTIGACPGCGQPTRRVLPEQQTRGRKMFLYRGHADPAETSDNFAFAIGHLERFVDPVSGEATSHVVIDLTGVWKPEDYPNHHVPYVEVRDELFAIIRRFPTVSLFTYDQYGAFATIGEMAKLLARVGHQGRVRPYRHTQDNNRDRANIFKEALAMGRVHTPRDTSGPNGSCLLDLECRFLQLRNDRVTKQTTGPVVTDDLYTVVSVVVSELLHPEHGAPWRERLSEARPAFGLPGGYHSGSLGASLPRYEGTAREQFDQFVRDRARGRGGYGNRRG